MEQIPSLYLRLFCSGLSLGIHHHIPPSAFNSKANPEGAGILAKVVKSFCSFGTIKFFWEKIVQAVYLLVRVAMDTSALQYMLGYEQNSSGVS